MSFINRFKINRNYNLLKKDTENHLKDSIKPSNFNSFRYTDGYDYHLENYMYEEILYCFVRATYSDDINEKRFHSNILIRLLGSFLDLYAQILNSFYDLELIPLRKKIAPAYGILGGNGIVKQAVSGVDNLRGSNAVSIDEVCRTLEANYSSNEYFDNIKTIIHSEEMKSLKILRNYVTHYQSVFSKCNHSYLFDKTNPSHKIFNVNGSSIDKQEHEEFISLASKIIKLEVDLIFNFKLMYYDKKMVKIGENTEIAYILECPDCGRQFHVTELQKIAYEYDAKIKIKHKGKDSDNDCLSKKCLNLIDETVEIHPERFSQLLSNEINSKLNGNLSVFDKNGEKIFN